MLLLKVPVQIHLESLLEPLLPNQLTSRCQFNYYLRNVLDMLHRNSGQTPYKNRVRRQVKKKIRIQKKFYVDWELEGQKKLLSRDLVE